MREEAFHTRMHTHKITARLGPHVSTKLSFLSRLHQQMHTKARRNDSLEEFPHKRLLFPIRTLPQTSRFTTSTPKTAWSHRPYCTYYGFNSAFKIIYLHFKTSVCSKCKEMLILLYWPSERTNPMTSHTVVLQDGGALAPKAITKQPFFL